MPLLVVGCGLFDADKKDAIAYLGQVQPLMAENSLLAERTLVLAAGIHDKKVEDEGVGATWSTEIVPLASHLHYQASNVIPPESWTDRHSNLVQIWGERADAYRDLGEALTLADGKLWERAEASHKAAIDKEEQWFQAVSKDLQAKELTLDQYP